MGTAFSYFAYRLYHQPLRQGGGGSWGPRSRGRAFGFGSEAERKRRDDDDDGTKRDDVEMGNLNGERRQNVRDGAAVQAGAR